MHDTGYCRIPIWGRDGIRAYALVDPADFDAINSFHWLLHTRGYAMRATPRPEQRRVYMHRQILGLAPGNPLQCDHINRDKLDNRRVNLRAVTHAENQQNLPSCAGSTSKYRGVHWCTHQQRWTASVRGKYVGGFKCERAAALAAETYRAEHLPFAQSDPALKIA